MEAVFKNLAIQLATQDVNTIIDNGTHATRETFRYGRLKGIYEHDTFMFYDNKKHLYATQSKNDAITWLSKQIFNQ